MPTIHSFPPLIGAHCQRIILGSMPGKASLLAQQYYAHPRNHFWSFMESLFGIPQQLDYTQRCTALIQQNIAVWDVLKTCTRTSSLDSDIQPDSVVSNHFEQLFTDYPQIHTLYFNGNKAAELYQRHVLSNLPASLQTLQRVPLPSTSPANAAIPYAQKLKAWAVIAC